MINVPKHLYGTLIVAVIVLIGTVVVTDAIVNKTIASNQLVYIVTSLSGWLLKPKAKE